MSLNGRLAAYFLERPYRWVDARDLFQVAGSMGWRTRVSNLRTLYGMTVENRQRKVKGYTLSEYRYVPAEPQQMTLEQSA